MENLNVESLEQLVEPNLLKKQIVNNYTKRIDKFRQEIKTILTLNKSKFIVIVGPCSIHNVNEAIDYANKLKILQQKVNSKIMIIMRVYFEKPRTTVGWKGLINDPHMDNSCKINRGLSQARYLLQKITEIGLPIACEFLDTITPQYICDFVSYGAIGARTSECQLHRQLASGLSMPIGFKNGTNGNIDIAIDAIIASNNKHTFLGINNESKACIIKTKGNKYSHIILRGGRVTTNYDKTSINNVVTSMTNNNLPINIVVDCSHGNSHKNYKNQPKVVDNIIEQFDSYNKIYIKGIMLESNINEGKQKISKNLKYGVSVTDCCMSFETTEKVINKLYDAL
tara:strand:- start:691 stop:1710 length:1020 start_codon:yes stop_codon:yes gene_type:complete